MKLINETQDVKKRVLNAVSKIADPVVQTLSPLGGNVLYEDASGNVFVTNDGVTIAKQVSSDDPVEDAIIRVIKYGALKTNQIAGDGTTTTILLTSSLIRDGLDLIEKGMNVMELKKMYERYGERVIKRLNPIHINDDEELLSIARISSSGDEEISQNVFKIVKTAGDSGMVFINPSTNDKTEIIEDTGFVINQGFLHQALANDGTMKATYENVHIMVTDKRLYYEQECKTILEIAIKNGIKNLVIVARDFIGKAPNFLIANHTEGFINLLLIKHPDAKENDSTPLSDLATYLGCPLITEKQGKLVNGLTLDDFTIAKKVYATKDKSVIVTNNPENNALVRLINELEEAKERDKEDKETSNRLATLTTGTVTISVSGKTPIETQEKIFRYEDAINATRSAMKDGYLVGGGLSLLDAGLYYETREDWKYNFATASIRQIANNCGLDEEEVLCRSFGGWGYNVKTGKFEDLVKAGVIDPYQVTKMAVENSISIAIAILTSRFIITNSEKDLWKTNKWEMLSKFLRKSKKLLNKLKLS